ncbi:MPN207a family PTS transporter accessory protein [Mycoplasmoides genitalium]
MQTTYALLVVFGILLVLIGLGFLFWALKISLKEQKKGQITNDLTSNNSLKNEVPRGSWWKRNNKLVLFLLAIVFLMLGIGGLFSLPKLFG